VLNEVYEYVKDIRGRWQIGILYFSRLSSLSSLFLAGLNFVIRLSLVFGRVKGQTIKTKYIYGVVISVYISIQ
jgi:hypothetical protein